MSSIGTFEGSFGTEKPGSGKHLLCNVSFEKRKVRLRSVLSDCHKADTSR